MKLSLAFAACVSLISSSPTCAFTPNKGPSSITQPSALTNAKHVATARRKNTQLYLEIPPLPFSLPSLPTLPELPPLEPKAQADLLVYFFQSLISVGTPAVIYSLVAVLILKTAFGGRKEENGSRASRRQRTLRKEFGTTAVEELYDDLYGAEKPPSMVPPFLEALMGANKGPPAKGAALKNAGIPSQQYIKVERLNDKYDSYAFSIDTAIDSKASAAAKMRSMNFDRAMGKVVGLGSSALTASEKTRLLNAEQKFLKEAGRLTGALNVLQTVLVKEVIEKQMEIMKVGVGELDPITQGELNAANVTAIDADIVAANVTSNVTALSLTNGTSDKSFMEKVKGFPNKIMNKPEEMMQMQEFNQITELQNQLIKTELDFIAEITFTLGNERANAIRVAILGNSIDGVLGGNMYKNLSERPLSTLLSQVLPGNEDHAAVVGRKNLFVTTFPGDTTASQVKELREEVTAIVRSAKPGDEVLLVLESGGGTVTGYGLAAAQLKRFKDANLKLTICVEQVAASGGYMMCCIADHIVASPFAVLGSIGVISDQPNVYERLKKEGIEFQTVTAGKYKRTITPTKKVTQEDLDKSKEDVEAILKLFSGFVASNRPILDIENVATGETWFDQDALDRNLCDEIKTTDEVLGQFVDNGYDVYSIKYDPVKEMKPPSLLPSFKADGNNGIIRSMVRYVAKEVSSELMDMNSQASTDNVASKFRMEDPSNTAGRMQMKMDSDSEDLSQFFKNL
mmetsp:Transcript_43139/g.51764  ORF Transcript_43139/g.51764 Transcript_43139/m.51764 type:complete len:740 (-) Transcript_43139:313-2532(-)